MSRVCGNWFHRHRLTGRDNGGLRLTSKVHLNANSASASLCRTRYLQAATFLPLMTHSLPLFLPRSCPLFRRAAGPVQLPWCRPARVSRALRVTRVGGVMCAVWEMGRGRGRLSPAVIRGGVFGYQFPARLAAATSTCPAVSVSTVFWRWVA